MLTIPSPALPLAALTLACLPLSLAHAGDESLDPFERFELPGGVRLVVWQVGDAPRQTTFTFLPLGLALDGKHSAQYSHLVEHMIIRSTDPDALETPGISFNGETSAGALRIESYAEPDKWQESLDRHLRWLQLELVDEVVLEREKGRIEAEEQSTVMGGYTHKWAEAGWNQAVRFGLPHAAVHEDVVQAGAEGILAYAKAALARHDEILIASVGPIDPLEIRDQLEQELVELSRDTDPQADIETSPTALEHVTKSATWDLAAHHYLEWIPLPDRDHSDRIAGTVLTQLVNIGLYGDKTFSAGHALASVIVVPEGRYLMLSANLSGPDQAKQASTSFKKALEGAGSGGSFPLPMALMQLKAQARQGLDPTAGRKQLERMKRDVSLVEAQMLLTAVMNEWQLGLTFDQIGAAWEPIDVKWMEAYLERIARIKNPSSLLLRPK